MFDSNMRFSPHSFSSLFFFPTNPIQFLCTFNRFNRTIQISADIESTLEIITEMLKYFEEVSLTLPCHLRSIPTDDVLLGLSFTAR